MVSVIIMNDPAVTRLQQEIAGITHATLTKQLRILENYGLVVRTVYPQIPPKVEYSLSDIGKKVEIILDSVLKWGKEYILYLDSKK